jgi:ribosomal protein S15P/S13E
MEVQVLAKAFVNKQPSLVHLEVQAMTFQTKAAKLALHVTINCMPSHKSLF